ncbi:MAG: hypothetical protein HGA16_00205, partial [Candidatus Moranbacteria bacterium]|nr:hypothetical protein [Candidatus Moranbacteria bacterium]
QQEEIDSLSFRLDTLDLSTGKTATTLGGLQSSVDAQLTLVGDTLSTLGKDADSIDGRLSAIDSRVLSIESDITDLVSTTNGQDTRIGDLEEDMALLRDEHEAVMGFFSSFKLNHAVMKDEEGNVDLLGGKLSVRTLSTGELEIEVVDPEAPTLGTATLYPVAKDKDDDGLDDYTGLPMSDSSVISRDGKSMTIRTKAVSKSSRIFITPDVAEPIAVTERRTGKDFTVSTSDVISEKIRFDWMIVRELVEVGGESDANGGR